MPASVLRLFNGFIPSSLFCLFPFCKPFVIDSLSPEDCDKFLAFWADPRMPSREKLAIRREFGDLRGFGELRWPFPFPLVTRARRGEGISIENLSLDIENVLPPPLAEVGEASGEELDIAGDGYPKNVFIDTWQQDK
jgi:hypothetical protein